MGRRGRRRANGGATGEDPSGFTLIELLVVIAAIALLMAILLPALSRVRHQARAVACRANLRQWGMALAMYAHGNDGYFPSRFSGSPELWLLRGAFLQRDPNAARNSLHQFDTQGIACCPAATKPAKSGYFAPVYGNPDGTTVSAEGSHGSTFGAWELVTPGPAFRASYGCNSYLFQGLSGKLALPGGRPIEVDVFALKGAADTPALLDAARYNTGTFVPVDGGLPPMREFEGSDGGGRGGGTMAQFCCINRHNEAVNGLFLDWSVRRIGLKELWTLKWYREYNTAGRWTKAGGVQSQDWPHWMRRLKDH